MNPLFVWVRNEEFRVATLLIRETINNYTLISVVSPANKI